MFKNWGEGCNESNGTLVLSNTKKEGTGTLKRGVGGTAQRTEGAIRGEGGGDIGGQEQGPRGR